MVWTGTDANGCISDDLVTVTVNPLPVVDPIADQTICEGDNSAAINFTGAVAGTQYDWTNSNTAIGVGANGTGNIAAFTGGITGTSEVLTVFSVLDPIIISSKSETP